MYTLTFGMPILSITSACMAVWFVASIFNGQLNWTPFIVLIAIILFVNIAISMLIHISTRKNYKKVSK